MTNVRGWKVGVWPRGAAHRSLPCRPPYGANNEVAACGVFRFISSGFRQIKNLKNIDQENVNNIV